MASMIYAHYRYAAVSGLLMGLAFLHPFFWWGGILGIALFLVSLSQGVRVRDAGVLGLIAGTLKMLIAFSGLWAVYPLDWLGDFNRTLQLFGIGIVWILASMIIGAAFGAFACVATWVRLHPYRYLLLGGALVLSEILGSILFSVVMYGPGGDINAHLSIGYLGYTLARHGVLGFFAIGTGVYTLSCVVLCLGLLLMEQIEKARMVAVPTYHSYRKPLLMIFVLLVTYFLPLHPSVDGGISVATIHTAFPNTLETTGEEKAARVGYLIDTFEASLQTESDVIVFPETIGGLRVFGGDANVFNFIKKHTASDVVVVDSDTVPNDMSMAIRARVYDTSTKRVHEVYKHYLVPNGEFLPYTVHALIYLFGGKEVASVLDERLAYAQADAVVSEADQAVPAVLFCSESLSPYAAAVAREKTMPLIVHPISHAWFDTPTFFWYQLDLMLRTQVRMTRTPLAVAANMGHPFAYDAFGNPVVGETVYETASTSVVVYEL